MIVDPLSQNVENPEKKGTSIERKRKRLLRQNVPQLHGLHVFSLESFQTLAKGAVIRADRTRYAVSFDEKR